MIILNREREIVASKCRFCGAPLKQRFIDITFPNDDRQSENEDSGSISTYVCSECFLVQMEARVFFSSNSSSEVQNVDQYINRIFKRFEKIDHDLVAELANHGEHPERSGLQFGNESLQSLIDIHGKADLLICNDELAYVHDINDFISAIKLFLKPTGIVTFEFLHLLPLMERKPFQTPINKCFTYFSFTTIDTILKHHRLTIFDIEECSPTGCIRIYAKHPENSTKRISSNTPFLRGRERDKGMSSLGYYLDFKEKAQPRKTVDS